MAAAHGIEGHCVRGPQWLSTAGTLGTVNLNLDPLLTPDLQEGQ